MTNKNDRYRMRIYTAYAEKAKKENIKWVVAHGIEGYPKTIGRDLDILCFDEKDIQNAVKVFSDAAKADNETGWIVYPSTIWGKRVLAISNNFEVAELHILYRLNSGLIHCPIDWSEINKELFPINKKVLQFKGLILPLIGGTAKLWKYSKNEIDELPWTVKRLYTKNEKKSKINVFDKLLVYLQLGGGPKSMLQCYKYSKFIRTQFKHAQTSPIYYIPNYKEHVNDIEGALNELFFKIRCCDNYSITKINKLNQRQNMLVLTKERTDIVTDYEIVIEDKSSYINIVNAFCEYNKRRAEIYDGTFNRFISFIRDLN